MNPQIWPRTTLDRPYYTCNLESREMVQVAVSGSLLNRHMTRLCVGLYRDVHSYEPFPGCLIEYDTTNSFNCYERDVQIAQCSTFLLHTKSPAYRFGILLHPVSIFTLFSLPLPISQIPFFQTSLLLLLRTRIHLLRPARLVNFLYPSHLSHLGNTHTHAYPIHPNASCGPQSSSSTVEASPALSDGRRDSHRLTRVC